MGQFPRSVMKGKQLIAPVLFMVVLPTAWTQTGSVSQVCSVIPAELYLGSQLAVLARSTSIDQSVFLLEPADYGVKEEWACYAPESSRFVPSDPLLTPPEKGGVGVPWSWSRCYMSFISGLVRKEGIAVSATTLAGVCLRNCNA
jgi:hypothetical protein